VDTNADRVLAAIRREPGLTDRELRERTGVSPHQQVNAICRRLAAEGRIVRSPGPTGALVNVSTDDHDPLGSNQLPRFHAVAAEPVGDVRAAERVPRYTAERTLLVVACSAAKDGRAATLTPTTIGDSLPRQVREQLAAARAVRRSTCAFDDGLLVPAAARYSGTFWRVAGPMARTLASRGAHLVVLSGGYGVVDAREPIAGYDAVFKRSNWPSGLIERCLIEYCRTHGLVTAIGFLAASTQYAQVMGATPWSTVGVKGLVVSVNIGHRGGAQVLVPRGLGEAFTAYVCGQLEPGWRSTNAARIVIKTCGR
jgi:hypothetical protein